MMFSIENFIFELSIPLLEQKGEKWNGRCIVCGDSQKSEYKKRFWIERSKNHDGYFVHCYNCGYNRPFTTFIKDYFPDVFKNYYKLKFKNKRKHNKTKPTTKIEPKSKPKVLIRRLDLPTLFSLEDNHPARKIFNDRKLHNRWLKYLYYTDNYKRWINEKIPDRFDYVEDTDPRIVIPFYTTDYKIFAAAGRAIEKTKIRYMTIKFDDHPKIFGLERTNFNKPVYVFEGPIDSLFIPNSIAMGGSISSLNDLKKYCDIDNFILVPDIEPRNPEICKFIDKSLKLGFKVSLLPKEFRKYGKDVNDLIKGGLTRKQIYDTINANVVQGRSGLLHFKMKWKIIRK